MPKEIVNELKIKAGENLMGGIEKKTNPLKELFGALKFNKPTEQLLKEMRKDLGSKWI